MWQRGANMQAVPHVCVRVRWRVCLPAGGLPKCSGMGNDKRNRRAGQVRGSKRGAVVDSVVMARRWCHYVVWSLVVAIFSRLRLGGRRARDRNVCANSTQLAHA